MSEERWKDSLGEERDIRDDEVLAILAPFESVMVELSLRGEKKRRVSEWKSGYGVTSRASWRM